MHADLQNLLDRNQAWAAGVSERDPKFFSRLAAGQKPKILWIGCADSRVPETRIADLEPGDLFVHRNVANLVAPGDLNCLSTVQYAVDALKVRHVVICGHTRCGGVTAALNADRAGLVDNWLQHVRGVKLANEKRLAAVADPDERLRLLIKLNVIAQVAAMSRTTVVEDAWARGQELSVSGWVYGIEDGVLHDLDVTVERAEDVDEVTQAAAERVSAEVAPGA